MSNPIYMSRSTAPSIVPDARLGAGWYGDATGLARPINPAGHRLPIDPQPLEQTERRPATTLLPIPRLGGTNYRYVFMALAR